MPFAEMNPWLADAKLSYACSANYLDYLDAINPRAEQQTFLKAIPFSQVLQIAVVLAGKGDVVSALATEPSPVVVAQCERLNQHVMDKARSGGELSYLASPLTGGAMPVGRFHQLFLLSKAKGGKTPDDWASFAWETLSG